MNYNPNMYNGARIQLFPGDTYKKFGKIIEVDDLGFWIEITDTNDPYYGWEVGKTYFISHSRGIKFKLMEG